MNKVVILTQKNCPKCVALKSFLELGLRNKYQNYIEVISREENPDLFMDYVNRYDIMTTPVMISDKDVLLDTSPSKVTVFLAASVV